MTRMFGIRKTLKQNQDCVLMIAGSSPCEEEKDWERDLTKLW